MRPLRRLLFPTDYSSCADRAFAHAAYLAERAGAELRVLHAVVPGGTRGDVPDEPHVYTTPAGAALPAEERVGEAAEEVIVDYAAEQGVDLVVMGTHARRGPAHFVLGSTAERVVRHAPCPVMTVGPRAADPVAGAVRRLLVPIDFSAAGDAALDYAAALAALYGARVDLLHAVEVPTLPDAYGVGVVWPGWGPEVEERTRAALGELAARRLPEAHRGDVHVEVGDPAAATLDACGRLEADLIVMGTHGRTGLARFALGSAAERVVQRASCPVLVVKSVPEDAAAERGPTGEAGREADATGERGTNPEGDREANPEGGRDANA
jgi:nucleotide-binding universal stress UspA family protein